MDDPGRSYMPRPEPRGSKRQRLGARLLPEMSREYTLGDIVTAYVKNHGLGFEVPYAAAGGERRYRPDFIIEGR